MFALAACTVDTGGLLPPLGDASLSDVRVPDVATRDGAVDGFVRRDGAVRDSGADDARARDARVGDGPCNQAGLILCFPFDGDAMDRIAGRAFTDDGISYGPAPSGQGALFDQESSPAVMPGSDLFALPLAFTIDLWFAIKSVPDRDERAGLLDKNGSTGIFAYGTGEEDSVRLRLTTRNTEINFPDVRIDDWHHVVFVFAEGGATAYLDREEEVLTNSAAVWTPDIGGLLHVGSNADEGNDRLDGGIDQLRIWDRALTPTEARGLFARPSVTP